MRYLLPLLLVIGIFLYLNRSYAYFYDFQGDHFITNPLYPPKAELSNKEASKSAKLVVLGDSLSAGTGSSSQENSLSYLIAQGLAKKENIELINLAYPGVGTEDVLKRQVPQAIEEDPDYIILMIGINDVHNRLPEEIFKNDYWQILELLTQKTSAKITVINIPFIGSDKILYPPWDSVVDFQINKFNRIISELSNTKQLKVIDLYTKFKSQFKKSSDLYSQDQFHPSDKGYALWADYINENLNN